MRVFMCEYLGLKPDPLDRFGKRSADRYGDEDSQIPTLRENENESESALQRDSSELVSTTFYFYCLEMI